MKRLPPPELPDWIDRQLPEGVTRYRAEAGGRTLHVMEAGAGRPVLMVHGNPTWSFLYRKVIAALSGAGLRCVAPDLAGLGFSDRPAADWHSIENHAACVRELVEGLDLRGLIFVGQDWGGPIGLRALADAPERVGGLVILNTTVGPPKRGCFQERLRFDGRLIRFLISPVAA